MDRNSLVDGDTAVRNGRLAKAAEFRDAADTLEGFAVEDGGMLSRDSAYATAFVVLCVLSGIASADAICIRDTGKYARGGDHNGSIAVLEDAAGRPTAKHLDTLLTIKSKAEYSAHAIGDADIHNARGAADALVSAAR